MRVLHLLSNYKWTGPSDPALSLGVALRDLGVDVTFRISGYRKGPGEPVFDRARERDLTPLTDLSLSKHRSLWRDAADVRKLSGILARERIDLIHCHMPNDMRIALRASRATGTKVLRTLYDTEPARTPRSDLRGLQRASWIFVFSRLVESALAKRGLGERVQRIETAVDLDRFRPGPGLPNLRKELGFAADDFLAGIVARVQPQRRFDLLLDIAEAVAEQYPGFRLLVIGRGSKLERTAREPARSRGLLDRVVFFPGYFEGDDFPAVLRALDVKLFLVPGTDGTARAAREAMACGLPLVTSRRGILPELVREGETGFSVDERVPEFSRALLRLARDPALCARMGEAARLEACDRFNGRRQALAVLEAYRSLV